MHRTFLLLALLWVNPAHAQRPTRSEALEIARAFAEHEWTPSSTTRFHGLDPDGVDLQTPDAGSPGLPYKWGGFDDIESFERGLAKGKAAGDLYTAEKRRKGGDAVSRHAVGLDCSGFISRCWRLSKKHSTGTLVSLCLRLASPADLRPADIMNQPGGHVLLFARWLNPEKNRALFYEAEPFSKVRSSERDPADLAASGFIPMRYRLIRED